ncbi:filamentous hemagglutinin N-terminal domain-containing protein [Xanthomonas citri pv. fuscans CFBP 6996]|uniref:two-partner secretion domain-containing protein n=2 Tax=Xanthomonas citri TaxID=346 RepID=UPI000C17722E|nr:filamentous hemagglutinin N-terminal domain-containing protein [Xanthomonas citri]ATS49609.1 filamentous hemagglutinin N-terminal domain-containing protein [Xanthomonas citri pv. phaseoli var. fuscans]ATS55345.1 filamentous hemagglutinin N-terminal domain-containing protein [Xanthomonas citri pv. phaseoli var. fuscans]ATS60643.1 filamentous hemagglutinin N-terminal domain-containing protein [Xanthomonas citri pv. phaseoli var. fuscans]PTY28743.1 filamentous hemagglutinin N-terminal domain-co
MHATIHPATSPRTLPLRHRPLALALAAALMAMPVSGLAQVAANQLPTGGSIVGGTGTINAASGTTRVVDQTSARMALTWSAFDIGSAATMTFNQPTTTSVVLNLVQGGNPTQIFGNLTANGQVFLLNSNGVLLGSTANINVGGLVVSTLGTSVSQFMNGNYVFDAGGNTVALVSNSGTINAAAGSATLIGGRVANSGTITATAGNITLAGADAATLTFESGGFGVLIDKPLQLSLATEAVDNSGTLSAPGGAIQLQARAAQGIFDRLINNSGTIRASSLSNGPDGSVSLIASGAGSFDVAGGGSIDAGTGAITLSTGRGVQQTGIYTAGSLGGFIGGSATFSGANKIGGLGNLDVGGNLSLTNTVALSQSGSLAVTGTSQFLQSGSALSLTNGGNTFGGLLSASGNGIAVNAAGNLSIGTLNLDSNSALSLSTSGVLTLPTTAINTGSANLTLTSGGGLTTRAALAGTNVDLTGSGGIALAHDVTASGALKLTATNNAITQTAGSVAATGTSTINAGTGAITLDGASNDFQGAVALTGGNTRISDSGALTLGAVTSNDLTATSNGALNLGSGRVGGALLATSNNGAITQSGTDGLTILGTSNLTAGTGAITLTNSGNTFGDLVSATGRGISLNAAGTLSIGTLSLGNNSALSLRATGALTLPAAAINTGSANLTLSSGGSLTTRAALAGTNVDLTGTAGITLAHDVTASGTLALTTTDSAITQTGGSVTATGTSTVSAGTGVIELDEATNDFQGVVTLTGGDTRIADTGALTLGALNTGNLIATSNGALNLGSGSVRGTLAATSGNGAISQGAGLIVDGTATLNAGSGAIALTDGSNDFRSGVSLTGTGISVVDRDDLRVSSISNGTNGAIALTAGGALTLPTQNLSTGTGALSLTANGGALSTLGALSGGNVSLSARDGVVLNHNVTAGGTLGLAATNATITQNAGVLDVGGLATVDAGNGAISLTGDNDFKNGIALTGRNIAVVDANDLSVVSLSNGGAGAIALTARNSLTLPGSGLSSTDNLTLRADNGTLTLGGDLLGNAVSLFSANALTLATGIDSNTLSVSTSNSAINQTAGALRLGSTSSFDTGTGAIALGSAGNHFGGAVSLTGNGVSIRDSGALTLGTLNTGSLTATSNGALNLGSGRVAGTLAATSGNGAIGQAGGLIVDAAATLNAGSGAIALTDGSNDFQGSMRLTGAGIAVRDSNDLTLSALTSNNGGTIALTAGGNLILPGTTLNNGSGNINLIANHLSLSAALLGEEVSLRANSGLALGQNITARTLSLASSNAAITQSGGALLVSGATTVDAGTGAISLLQAGNNFDSVRLTGNGIGVTDGDNLSLAALTSTGTGAVVVTAGGTLSLPSQAIAVGNSNLTLSSNGGALSTAADLGGNDVTLFGRDGLTLGHTVTANTLALHSTDAAIVQNAGALDVVGASTVDAGSASIALNSGSNHFGAGISLTGTGITVADSGNLTINALNAGANGTIALTAGGALNLSAQNLDTGTADLALIANGGSMSTGGDLRGRNVTLSARDGLTIGHTITTTETLSLSSNNTAMTQTAAALNVGTTTTVNAGSGNVTINTAGNTFNGVVNLTAGDVQIAGNALSFGALSTNALTANSSGALSLGSGVVRGALNGTSGNAAITQSGGLSVGGASTLNAGSGDIALTDANNDFVGALALTGNAIAVQDRNDLSIAAARSGANAAIALVAGGDLNLPVSQIDAGTGALTLAANGGTLRTAGALRGGTVQLTGANGIALSNTVTASNVLRLNSTNAAITQTGGALLVAGDTAVDAGGGAIALEAAGNDFQGVLALTGGASSVRDANALTLGTLNTGDLQIRNSGALNLGVGLVNGDLDAASNGGAVTQSGALTVTGSARINSGGAAIALTDADNDFQAAVSLSGGTASVRDRNALVLGNLDVDALEVASGAGLDLGQGRIGGALVARSGSVATANANTVVAQAIAVPAATAAGIAQQGALTVVGSSLLDAGTGAIVLDAADNDFQGTVQARGSSIAIVDRNDLAATAQASDALRLQAGGQLTTAGTLSASAIALRGGTGVVLSHDVEAASVALSSGGAITQDAGSLRAGQLSGNAAGAVALTGSGNAIDVLGDFSAQGLDVLSNRTLLVSGRVDGGPSLRLRSGGELKLSGQLSGATSWLQAVAGIRQRAGSAIAATLLSGSAGGPVALGDAAGFIDNRVVRLGEVTASNGFSFTNGGDLLLVLANGSSYSVDAGNSAMFLSVRGNLFQDGRAPLRNGTGTFAATGQIGTQQNPIYVTGTGTQTVAAIGAPPAYFNATAVDGSLLDLAGASGFNVPASAFAGRAQSSASRTVAFVDLSASGTPYRAFGLVRPGLRLPDDQQPACDAGDPDAVCSPE